MPIISADSLRGALSSVFGALRVPDEDAFLVADHLVEAELAGVTSHGVMRLPQYVAAVEQEKVFRNAKLTVVRQGIATAVLDGGHGFGQVMVRQAMDRAVEMSGRTGVAAVTVVNCSHTGRLGSYTDYAARRGRIALMTVNTGGHGQWVAPFGGRDGRLSTNPLSIAIPRATGAPFMLDIATSAAPEGKVRAALAAGASLPPGWVVAGDGRPSTNPADLYGPPRGALLPFGGHKGFGLAFMVDALAGGLSGAGCCTDADAPLEGATDGVFIVLLDSEAFFPSPDYQAELERLVRHIKSSRLAEGFDVIQAPGEIEARETARRQRDGLPIADGVWEMLQRTFERYRVSVF